jgi:competence protein ComEA
MPLSVRDRIALAAGVGALIAFAVAGWLLVADAATADSPPSTPIGGLVPAVGSAGSSGLTRSGDPAAPDLVIDVEGAVARPGIVTLPAGARVADAIRAAGGYGGRADLAAAAATLNLAAALSDGQQVYVPRIRDAVAPGIAPGGAGIGAPGLVNMNTATPEELEALPGIGPVTTQQIVAARAERPFVSLEEMVERDVIDNGQLEDVRDLVTF